MAVIEQVLNQAGEMRRVNLTDMVEKLMSHPIYAAVNNEARMREFMRSHVFCVFDFQSLLKSLQRIFSCVEVPWLPTEDPQARRLVNELVTDEESDDCQEIAGSYLSHYELYLKAMDDCGADTAPIKGFVDALRRGQSVEEALKRPDIPEGVRQFVGTTFSIIGTGQKHRIAASFAHGREDVIPRMFQPLARGFVLKSRNNWGTFLDYLVRHIKNDEERHGPMCRSLMVRICGNNEQLWKEAEESARLALEARLALWDDIMSRLK